MRQLIQLQTSGPYLLLLCLSNFLDHKNKWAGLWHATPGPKLFSTLALALGRLLVLETVVPLLEMCDLAESLGGMVALYHVT